jgi:hypothetical protein
VGKTPCEYGHGKRRDGETVVLSVQRKYLFLNLRQLREKARRRTRAPMGWVVVTRDGHGGSWKTHEWDLLWCGGKVVGRGEVFARV